MTRKSRHDAQIPPKYGRTAHLVVAGDPPVRQLLAVLAEHLQRLLVTGLETHALGHARRLLATAIAGPLLGQVEPRVDQNVLVPSNVGHVNRHLAIVDLAVASAPLPGHAHRLPPLLAKRRRIEHDDRVRLAQFVAHLGDQRPHQRPRIPLGRADEVLQVPPVLVVPVGDRLDVLAFQVGQQPHDVLPRVLPLGRLAQARRKRLDKLHEPLHHATKRPPADLTLGQHLPLPHRKTSFHRLASCRIPSPQKT